MRLTVDIFIGVANRGGVENVINMTGAYLYRRGYRVRVVQAVWEHSPWTGEGIEFYYLSDSREDQTSDRFRENYVRFMLSHGAPDLILATAWPLMTWIARQAVEKAGLKSCRVISWLHAPIGQYKTAGYGGTEFLRFADAHFAISRQIADAIHRDMPDALIYPVKNPVAGEHIAYSAERSIDRRKLRFVGRLSVEKNIPYLIKAVADAKEPWKLEIVGDGDIREELEALVRESDLEEQVTFSGWLEHPWEQETDAAFLVLISAYEGCPVTAIESLLGGVPVISTPVGGVTDLIRPGENGYLFAGDGSEGLTEVLDYLSNGLLPMLDTALCRGTAECYLKENALPEYERILCEQAAE